MATRSTSTPVAGRWNVVRKGGAAVAAVALAVVLVGCGSDDEDPATTTPAATTAATTAPAGGATQGSVDPYGSGATTAPAGAATVTIDDFAFDPASPTFKVGQTVTVVNNDSAPHTWTSDDGGFDTGTIQPGQSATVTLEKAGTFDFVCSLHPSMTGTVTVQA